MDEPKTPEEIVRISAFRRSIPLAEEPPKGGTTNKIGRVLTMFILAASVALMLALNLGTVVGQAPPPPSYTIHVRELREAERVVRNPVSEKTTVLDAIESLKPQPANISRMDMWLVRPGKAGKAPLILRIDWVGLTTEGRVETNFVILNGDRLFLQSRFPK
jgi:hypothetical protein